MIWAIGSVMALGIMIMLWALYQVDSDCTGDCNQGRNCNCKEK